MPQTDLLDSRSSLLAPRHVATFNALHLGDNLIHVHFLRKLAQKYRDVHFTHGAPDQHLAQLYPLWSDVPNLTVKSIAEVGPVSHNAWRGAAGWFYQQPDQYDFLQIHLRWFRELARQMQLESPIECAADMLFDYPGLKDTRDLRDTKDIKDQSGSSESPTSSTSRPSPASSYDFLVINSQPMSGQWSGYSADHFKWLIAELLRHGCSVITTAPAFADVPCTQTMFAHAMDVTDIGRLSQRAKCIIGCVTGPMWPTLSVFHDKSILRIHLLDHERVELAPNTVHANSLSLVPEILKDRGLL